MHSSRKSAVIFAASTLTFLLVSACGGGLNDGPKSPVSSASTVSLHGIVYGATDTSVPPGAGVSITMMGQMRALFDLIRKAPDFTQVV
ncbi:hypothetical protein QMN58_27670, partial [Escherichia coli]|nr:hypothetical protein [Escherichia coli]